jgi:hypothetical protein
MTKVSDLYNSWMKNKEYRKAYDDLAPEFASARAVIKARITPVSNQNSQDGRDKIEVEIEPCN